MKKVVVALSVCLITVVMLSSCKKVIDKIFPGIDANVPDVTITVPVAPIVPPNEMSIGSYSVSFNLDSIIRANTGGTFGVGVVKSIKLKSITVTITNSDNVNNLSNFETARVMLTSSNNDVPVSLMSMSFPDTNSSTYTVTPTDSPELITYLKGSQLTYNMFGKLRKPTTKTLNMVVSAIVTVK